ncbi:hypothetical protein MTO96_015907 [Rhipicephalus appendiculatus]
MEPSIRGLEPERSIIHQEHGTSSSAEHRLTVLTYKPQLHSRHMLLCMFTKADMNSDTGGITNTSSCLWKLCKGSLRPSGACAEHCNATTGSAIFTSTEELVMRSSPPPADLKPGFVNALSHEDKS